MSTSAFPTSSWWCSEHGNGIGPTCPFCEERRQREAASPLSMTNPLNRIAVALERIALALEAEHFKSLRAAQEVRP